nr:hypothetical protein [Tanacetum cinerariifolium]
MNTEEVSDIFVAPCFVNGLEAYDGEINLGVEENMISNEYAVKLCLEREVKRGSKVAKKELIVALRETKEEEKSNDDWDHFLDFNIDDVPLLGEGLPPFVCKIGKNSRSEKRAMENLNFFYQDVGTSSLTGGHLTQKEAAKEAIVIRMGCHGEIDDMLKFRLREARSDEEIFTSVAWIRAFNINEPIYAELCHEFYSTYEFNKVCADDELQTKKIIKFRLGGRAHNLTLLEFARRLGLYQAVELEKKGFNVYFEGGLRNDEHFNAQDYWLSISREENLSLSRSHTSTIRNLILRVIYKMITYGLCQRTTGYDKIQKNDLWLLSMFDVRHKIEDVPGVPRVGIPKPPRASMQDLYDRMGRIEICQKAIEQMEYRQSYHWDMYQGVFEHMAEVYNVPLQGGYNLRGYAQL